MEAGPSFDRPPEAIDIFDFILNIHQACRGDWNKLIEQGSMTSNDLKAFLEYSALFLCNLGNFYGEGGQKFVPNLSVEVLQKIASVVPDGNTTLERIIGQMLAVPPFTLGYPGENTMSNYYPGDERITREEIATVSKVMDKLSVEPENTRVRKCAEQGKISFKVLQASVETTPVANMKDGDEIGSGILLIRGDHAAELSKICSELEQAKKYAANDKQSKFLSDYIKSFRTGSLDAFRESQKSWVTDISPAVENLMGFVEPYRDPQGIRAKWEGVICISDPDETMKLKQFVERSSDFIRALPWAVPGINEGKCPFGKTLFEAPDFTSVHALAFCASMVFEAANLPNASKFPYNDIRETCGFKNVVIANRMDANHNPASPCHYIHETEKKQFKECTHLVRKNPPISPLTNSPIETWYKKGHTWTGVFKDIATTVGECRATLVSNYLIDNKDLLAIFGFTDTSPIIVDEFIYNTYLQIGVEGLHALEHYNVKDHAWGEAHKRSHFAILKHLVLSGGGVMRVERDAANSNLTVPVDRSRILSHGKPALGDFLCRIHIWRCTADVEPCREFYEAMSAVDGEYEKWRKIVCSKPEPRWKFVQANTFLKDRTVEVKDYAESNEGIIQSWAERKV
ncbi:peptidase family M49-domain-containing protein [Leptodontidium sp. 2 PMI_412]|nr:peptidase family M49-domain-containing protein [Leptodontidium sp. 2 PMI_412]